MTAREKDEAFLSRWSRLKRAARTAPDRPAPEPQAPDEPRRAEPPAAAPRREAERQKHEEVAPRELPPVDTLTPDSDFAQFMDPKVNDDVRRQALKKLYMDPHFNVLDMLDDYAEDYTQLERLPASLVGKLAHARSTLFGRDDGREGQPTDTVAPPAEPARIAAAPEATDPGPAPTPAEEAEAARPPERPEPEQDR